MVTVSDQVTRSRWRLCSVLSVMWNCQSISGTFFMTRGVTQLLTRTNNHHQLYLVTTCPEIEKLENDSNGNISNEINVFVSHVSLGNAYLAEMFADKEAHIPSHWSLVCLSKTLTVISFWLGRVSQATGLACLFVTVLSIQTQLSVPFSSRA